VVCLDLFFVTARVFALFSIAHLAYGSLRQNKERSTEVQMGLLNGDVFACCYMEHRAL